MIIDFHTHTFPGKISAKTVSHLSQVSHSKPWTDGSMRALTASMKRSGIDYSVNLPVATSQDQVPKINRKLACNLEVMKEQGILTLGCMHPDYEHYKDELVFLKDHHIPGIKLHPAYQGMDLDDIRMMRVIDAASELNMVVLIHAGIDIGIYDHNYSSVPQILKVIEKLHPPKFVLAHMGGWGVWDEVESYLSGADVWFDTAFSIGPIVRAANDPVPPYLEYNLKDEDFIRIIRKHGTGRILFATDSPWADQQDYVNHIDRLPFNTKEKDQIFYRNASLLLGLIG